MVVNGYNVKPLQFGESVLIPQVYLQKGVNNIGINYTSHYNNDGLGCLSFIDTTTTPRKYYTYTHFEPYSAHRFIPCFDQPDLKASVAFNIITPKGYIASSNEVNTYQSDYDENDYISHAPYQD